MRTLPFVLFFCFTISVYQSNAQQVMNQVDDNNDLVGNLSNAGRNPVNTASLGNTNKNINLGNEQVQGNYYTNQAPVQQQAFDNNVIQSYSPVAERSRSSMPKLNMNLSTASASSGSSASSSRSHYRTHQASAALHHFLKKEENLVRKKKSKKKKAHVDVAACWH